MLYDILKACVGFQWDKGNATKNWDSHHVTAAECENIFFNKPLILGENTGRSKVETRYFALGHTDAWRELFVVFTIREDLIRIISARDMNRKEKRFYYNYEKDSEI